MCFGVGGVFLIFCYFSELLTRFTLRHALLVSHFSLLVQRKVTKRKHINDPTFNRGEKKGVPHASKAPSNSPPHSIRYLTTHWLFSTDYFYMTPLSASLSPERSLFCSKHKTRLGFSYHAVLINNTRLTVRLITTVDSLFGAERFSTGRVQ